LSKADDERIQREIRERAQKLEADRQRRIREEAARRDNEKKGK
jgi:hypothetical protein